MRIIFVVCYSPPYELFENQPRLQFRWELPNGSWAGVAGNDWGDQLGKAMTEYNNEVMFETWQVDLRADRIYTAELSDRLLHRLFPARKKLYLSGLDISPAVFSHSMIDYAVEFNSGETLLMLPATVTLPLIKSIRSAFSRASVIHYNLVNTKLLLPRADKTINPIRHLHRILIAAAKDKNLRHMNNLLYLNDDSDAVSEIRNRYPDLKISKFRLGLDLDYWKRSLSKQEARARLKIDSKSFIMVLSQRLVPEYQIDKFLDSVAKMDTKQPFRIYVTGHGSPEYEQYLKDLAIEKKLENTVSFVGYISDEQLKDYLCAADIFGTFAEMFAGSRGAIKAMALETPVMHVTLGSTYEFLRSNQAGIWVDPHDYRGWTITLQELIEGKQVAIVPRAKVEAHYGWSKTAEEVMEAIDKAKGAN